MLNTNEPQQDDEEQGSGSNAKTLVFALTAVMLLVVAARIYFVSKQRRDAETATVDVNAGPSHNLSKDDYILPRKLYAHTLADARALDGKPIWAFAGNQMSYYPATPAHVNFAKAAGLLQATEELDITNFIEQVAPASLFTRIPRGDRQVLMLFHRKADPAPLYGLAVGYHEPAGYTFYLDEAFFLDDPHVTYNYWPANIWQAIDQHKPALGMNELQAQLALGQVSRPGDGKVNDRTVTYDNNGHPVTITFQNKKATKIE